jgi:hypothetical protein
MTLTFHGIGEQPQALADREADVWISKAAFLSWLDAAAERGDVGLIIDDGNTSDLEHALPVLRARGLHPTFPPMDRT